jgi:cell division protein FtsW
MAVYFVGGGRIYHIIVMILIGIIGLFLMVQVKDYQADRFKCFLDPSFSRQDKCYQINQSLIAVGSGGFFGRGLGESRQKYMYIPEIQGDSIFAIIAEESGFIFSSILIILYVYVFYRGYLISKYAPDIFGRILAIGIVSWIVIQAFFNIGGMINVVPMTGVPLPLVSYGGSAITAALAAVGILVNISKQTKVGR